MEVWQKDLLEVLRDITQRIPGSYIDDIDRGKVIKQIDLWWEQVGNVAKPNACPQLCAVADNSGDIMKEAVENALYATGRFTTDQCTNLSEGIVLYIKDSGLKISRQ